MGRYAIFNGLVYGGGTNVIPNPEGTPTDELHSIQIDEDIYEIIGGSGASAIEKTQAEYDALTPAQKTNGAIYMVQGEAEIIETPIDMSSITSFIEESSIMSVASTTDTTTVTYRRAGDSVGCTFYYTNKIDLTTVNQVKFGLETGDNYHQADSPQNPIHIGFCSTAPSGFSPTFDVEEEYYLRNHTYDEEDCIIDTSELTGEYYLTVISHGWNLTISDFVLEDTGEVLANKIYYMGTEYANTNGGSGGGGKASLEATVLYDTPITANGTYTLADSYENYDFISIKAGNGTNETDIHTYAVDDLKRAMNDSKVITNPNTGGWFNFTISANELTIPNKTVYTIYGVIGYKIVGGGGGSSVEYSTEEKEVGTWIDGKKVYQKTIHYTHNDTIGAGYTTIASLSNVDYIEFMNCSLYNPTNKRAYALPYAYGSSTTALTYDNGDIKLRINNDTWNTNWDVVVTVRYTKAVS